MIEELWLENAWKMMARNGFKKIKDDEFPWLKCSLKNFQGVYFIFRHSEIVLYRSMFLYRSLGESSPEVYGFV